MSKKKPRKFNRLTLRGLCESKAQRFKEEIARRHETTNVDGDWLYRRIKRLLTDDNYVQCEACGMKCIDWSLDHRIPKKNHKDFPKVHDRNNIQVLCYVCNSLKGDKSNTEYLDSLKERNVELAKLANTCKEKLVPPFPHIDLGTEIFRHKPA